MTRLWVSELTEAEGLELIESTLQSVTANDGYLEAPEAQQGLAAAEVVAALKGRPAGDVPDEVLSWVENHNEQINPAIPALALEAVTRIRENSELRELWEEGDPAEWQSTVDDLSRRLKE